jgi:hypothetical protein
VQVPDACVLFEKRMLCVGGIRGSRQHTSAYIHVRVQVPDACVLFEKRMLRVGGIRGSRHGCACSFALRLFQGLSRLPMYSNCVVCSWKQRRPAYIEDRSCQHTSGDVCSQRLLTYAESIRQHTHTSAYVRSCQHTSAYVSIRQHTSAYVSIRQHTSKYVSIRQHSSAYVAGD